MTIDEEKRYCKSYDMIQCNQRLNLRQLDETPSNFREVLYIDYSVDDVMVSISNCMYSEVGNEDS